MQILILCINHTDQKIHYLYYKTQSICVISVYVNIEFDQNLSSVMPQCDESRLC